MTTGDELGSDTAPATFTTRSGDAPGTHVLVVAGEVDVATSPEFRRELHRLLDAGTVRITVDLRETTFMDSSGLGVLVGVLKRLRSAGSSDALVLEGLQDPVRRVFDVTGLTGIFTIRD